MTQTVLTSKLCLFLVSYPHQDQALLVSGTFPYSARMGVLQVMSYRGKGFARKIVICHQDSYQ